MGKVLLSIRYEIQPSKRDEYISVIKELKSVIGNPLASSSTSRSGSLREKTDGLENYSVFEVKGKANHFEEIYTYSSVQAYEDADDSENERINILINKITEMTIDNSTKYTTLFEIGESN